MLLSIMSCLEILEANSLLVTLFANYFFPAIPHLRTYLEKNMIQQIHAPQSSLQH